VDPCPRSYRDSSLAASNNSFSFDCKFLFITNGRTSISHGCHAFSNLRQDIVHLPNCNRRTLRRSLWIGINARVTPLPINSINPILNRGPLPNTPLGTNVTSVMRRIVGLKRILGLLVLALSSHAVWPATVYNSHLELFTPTAGRVTFSDAIPHRLKVG
jgi:hypothetical protein